MSAPAPVIAAGGEFLVSPNLGLMIWTLLAFVITLLILRRYAFPKIAEALDKRRRAIEESIDHAESTRQEADKILAEYRERLQEARSQADDIVQRAHRAADNVQEEAKQDAKQQHEEMMESTRREIERETQRSLEQIRREVANLTVTATEKVTRKSLDDDDHQRLVREALEEVDFSQLAPAGTSIDDSRDGGEDDGDRGGGGER
jgi:F-type H+-transporting ATPase subunit b